MTFELFRLSTSMNQRPIKRAAVALALSLAVGSGQPALADPGLTTRPVEGVRNSVVLESNVLSGISGVSNTNMAAGGGNQQSNSGVLAIGTTAHAASILMQGSVIGHRITSHNQKIGIKDRAFRQSEGWLSINQAAGQGNVQSNSMGVALGISASNLSDATLQQVMADQQGLSGTSDGAVSTQRRIEVDKTSFEGARGIIQVNQSAGTGNATSNSFRLNVALGQ